jgi:hypothetical protein
MKTKEMPKQNTKNILRDLILTGDLSVLEFFDGEYEVSLKIDGSPCYCMGNQSYDWKLLCGDKKCI